MGPIENLTKQKLRAGELALGFGVHHLRSSGTAMIAAATGHDWLFIDMEHGAFSVQEATQICLAALSTGVTPIVRVTAANLDDGARALDNGAMGVIVAAPTAGACAGLPGACIGAATSLGLSVDEMTKAMLAAGMIGVFVAAHATFAAEVGGCQAECGSGSGMAAAALVTLPPPLLTTTE